MKTKQRKEAKEDPRSRRAVVREFADEKSAGVVDAKPIWSGVALRRPGKDRPFCTGLGSGLLQHGIGSGLLQHGIGRRCLIWSADPGCSCFIPRGAPA